MNNENKNQHTGVILYQPNKKQSKEQAYKKDAIAAYQAKVFAECKADRLQAENCYFANLLEYLSNYVMRATTIEELEEAKAGYREFQQRQAQKYNDKMKEQSVIWVSELKR